MTDSSKPSEVAPKGRRKTGTFQSEILGGLSFLDMGSVKADDALAYATGYITGKTGQPKDPMSGVVPIPDYDAGWELGTAVFEGRAERPGWDRETPKD